jgi:hypothetical protein
VRRRGREEKFFVAREKPAACCLAAAIGNALHTTAIDTHYVLLVACPSVASALQSQPFAVVAEIRFGVFSTECYLPERAEMRFSRIGRGYT